MKISENTSVSMPVKNMIGIVIAVSMGIFAYTELTSRLTSLETSRELFQADLLKKSEAIINIHSPDSSLSLKKARRRLVFDEFFFLQLNWLLLLIYKKKARK